MKPPGRETGTHRRGERGLTPVVGFLLLFAIVVVGSGAILYVATSTTGDLEDRADTRSAELTMQEVDNELKTLAYGGDGTTTLDFADQKSGEYDVVTDGRMEITVRNDSDHSCSRSGSLGTLVFENDQGQTVGYQAGGVWKQTGDASYLVSEPDIRYYTETVGDAEIKMVDMAMTNVSGSVGTGEHTASQSINESVAVELDCLSNDEFRYVKRVEIVVEDTRFHEAWYEFLREEFDATDVDCSAVDGNSDNVVCHDEDAQKVEVSAALDYDRPLTDYVDIDPTIYGGLYTERDGTIPHSIVVDGYDGAVTTYDSDEATDDLLLVEGEPQVELTSSSEVEGHLVVSDGLQVPDSGGPTVTGIAFYNESTDFDSSATACDENLGIVGCKIEAFETIDPIDDQVEEANGRMVDDAESMPDPGDTIDAGRYATSGDGTLEDVTIDTSDGDVYVSTNKTLTLDDVTVKGDGTVRTYVGGDVEVADDVNIVDDDGVETDRARALQIYGTSTADVTIESGVAFEGVIYAPDSRELDVDGAEIFGAVVGGTYGSGDVTVHFDKSLRTDDPIQISGPLTEDPDDEASRDPIDVMFVIDESGSMDDNDPDEKRIDATRMFVGMLNASRGDQAGAVEFHTSFFGDDAELVQSMTGDLDNVNSSLTGSASGGTNMAAGIETALPEYDSGRDSKKIMILLSDGENSEDDWDEDTRDQAEKAADEDVTIYTIGLGDDTNEELLGNVSNQTGGEYVPVGDASDLEDVFEDIADDVTTPDEFQYETPGDRYEPPKSVNDYVIDVVESDVEIDD